jgi:phospholipid/cholesterol/gamma-HCH transport system substrate-binding protein
LQIKTETKVGIFVIIALAILGYMAVQLGAFKWHLRSYEPYTAYFKDVSGLIKKADAKIAGVKVGWVDRIKLSDDGDQAEIILMVNDQYKLYANAFVEIQQEGLLGPKYLDVMPGTSSNGQIAPGSSLSKKGRASVSIEDLMYKFDNIAKNIDDVSVSLKNALGTPEQQKNLKSIVENVSNFSEMLSKNQESISSIVKNMNKFADGIAPIGKDLQRVAKRLDEEVLPSFQQNMEKISDVFDRDFDKVANRLTDTFDSVQSVADKINNGEGVLGKLVNETQIYDDVKAVACSFREASDAYDNMGLVVDSHVESMGRPSDGYNHKNSKGYFSLRLHTNEDWFYLFQIVGSEKGGVVSRSEVVNTYFDKDGNKLTDAEIPALSDALVIKPAIVKETKLQRNTTRYSYQIGKSFDNLAFRFGAFESYFGVAVDYEIPFDSDNLRWVSSLEAFDFKGQERLNDRRPHLKWLNRVFFLRNFYTTFGIDDFASKNNINPFFGVGIRFGDDDLKILLGKFSMPK